MTELDVKLYEAGIERYKALRNPNESIGEYVLRKEQEERLIKSQPLKVLSEIAQSRNLEKVEFDLDTGEIPDDDSLIGILDRYFKIKRELHHMLTSFHHSGIVRVFKTRDVVNYYGLSNHKNFVIDLFREHYDQPLREMVRYPADYEKNLQRIEEWLKLPNPFLSEIPVGVGPDDARILHQVVGKIGPNDPEKFFVLISNDQKLFWLIASVVRNLERTTGKAHEIYNLSVEDYLAICRMNRISTRGFGFYNVSLGYETDPPRMFDELYRKANRFKRIRPVRHMLFFLYDFPNIEKSSHSIRSNFASWMKLKGGYLTKSKLNEVFLGRFPIWPIPELFDGHAFHQSESELKPEVRLRRRNAFFERSYI